MELENGFSAVVTGAASGLGEATARRLAHAGVKVAIFDLDKQRGQAVAADIGGIYCHTDVTSEDSVAAAFAQARTAHGQERILVNCAGIATVRKTVGRSKETRRAELYPVAELERVIAINLVGTFRCIAHAAAGMLELPPLADGERGVIVNTSSVAAQDGQMGQVAYAASKAGVLGMALPVARDLMADGIRVNTILPGLFETPMMASLPEKARLSLAASVPFPKRLGHPDEFAELVFYMVTNGYVNAEAVRLDGAIRMAPR
ncbi:SDR family NAD(P)-dependent oxidoreductase [Sphingobium phenoxybenzoativorans]|uniref:SDR family NAD(P)-dependent oxidoreductase n=1 Tax=Sphingobium phenoxybenzoativorans TaxID=1592790 RepID=A0A975K8Q8_9SPHN|nr:SDR family NAD(P)-dependent oxidoreductase [Sphingobium phenoxybenzoativorans]QUT05512.1 SDR family NAD(P)-dependent oxidoreductase [Sphingobium phenoxybenzoativorans]